MTQKRIKAEKRYVSLEGWIHCNPFADDYLEPCYVIRQSDIRALAEQMVRSSVEWYKLPESAASDPRAIAASLHCLKRAGMTPGRKERAK